MTKAEQIEDLEKQLSTLRKLRAYDEREIARLRWEILYWKGFVPLHVLKNFPFPQEAEPPNAT